MIRAEIFDFQFNRLGSIEQFESISYTKKYQDVGSFSLICPITDINNDLLQKRRIIWIEDNVAGIVQYISKKREENEDETLEAKGKLISEVLSWRWVYPCFAKTGKPNILMEQLVNTHCVNPLDSKRKLDSLVIGSKGEIANMDSVTYQKTGDSVTESLINLATANNLGFDVEFNPRIENKLKFVVYQGVDRTVNNKSGNDPVYFTQSLNNLLSAEYTYNDESFRNVELVAGEAEDGTDNENAKRRVLEVYLNDKSKANAGYDRYEKFVDARDLQSEYSEEQTTTDEDGNQVTETVEKKMSDEQYFETLKQRGNEKFEESTIEESYTGSIRTDSKTIFQYKDDYDVGDKVTVIDNEFAISMDVVITEMTVTYDKDLYTYQPTFGVGIPTILKKIQRSKRR